MKKILVMNGPNLDMLGVREPSVYGHETLSDLERLVKSHGASRGLEVACFQSNSEGALVDKIHEAHAAFDGIVYNPGAHTHYSYALRDALGGIEREAVHGHRERFGREGGRCQRGAQADGQGQTKMTGSTHGVSCRTVVVGMGRACACASIPQLPRPCAKEERPIQRPCCMSLSSVGAIACAMRAMPWASGCSSTV